METGGSLHMGTVKGLSRMDDAVKEEEEEVKKRLRALGYLD